MVTRRCKGTLLGEKMVSTSTEMEDILTEEESTRLVDTEGGVYTSRPWKRQHFNKTAKSKRNPAI